MLKINKPRTIILISVLLPSYSYASCVLNDNTYICSGTDTTSPELVSGSNELSVIFEDGYKLIPDNGSALHIDSGSKIVSVTSKGSTILSASDDAVIDISATGEGNAINASIKGDITSAGNGYGFVLNSEGDSGKISLDYDGNMTVNSAGIVASSEDNSSIDIKLSGEVRASYAINTKVGSDSSISIINNANMVVEDGITDSKLDSSSAINFANNADIISSGQGFNIFTGDDSSIDIINNKSITSEGASLFRLGNTSTFNLENNGDITSQYMGMQFDFGDNINLHINNKGSISGREGMLIYTSSSFEEGKEGAISIINSGSIKGENVALSLYGAWANYYIENAGAITAGEGRQAISARDQKSFTLALKQGWSINGNVEINPEQDDILIDNKIILTGDGDSSISLSRFKDTMGSTDTDSIVGINRLEKEGDSMWTLTDAQTSGQFESVDIKQGDVLLDRATILVNSLNNESNIYVDNYASVRGDFKNNGRLYVNNTNSVSAGNALFIEGNYEGGDGSTVIINTALGNDNSATDKLIISGNTTGNSIVTVNNMGGKGAKTIEGIQLISVAGDSAGVFTQSGRIIAGAYDYSLVRGKNNNGNNWYLTSSLDNNESVYRPEAGSYIANIAAANTLFNTRLHDRQGETQYVDALTGEKKVTSLWLRQLGERNKSRDSSGQLKTQSNSYVVQLGGDIAQWSTDGLNRGHIGLMNGYANSRNNTRSSATGYHSKGSLDGYSIGAYGSWFANDVDKSGFYVDSWLQYNWFNNHVNAEKLASESYKSKGMTGSLETGYTLKMGEFSGSQSTLNEWFIQPQAQVTWMGVKADDHRENNGTKVSSDERGNFQTRLGMRVFLKSHHAMDDGKDRIFEPFVEANWLHNTRDFGVKMDEVRVSQAGARNLGEIKMGVEGQLSKRLNLWGNVGVQVGDKGYNDSSAMIGAKYNF